MKIAHLDLGEKPLLLAPMEDVSDAAFRAMCRSFGASMVYTEFISADALIRSVPNARRKMKILGEERPAVIQIYGKDPDAMADAALIAADVNPDIIDLNFGCPVKRIACKGAGSGLLRDIPLMLKITEQVVKKSPVPVSVKTRLGWDHSSIVIEELAEQLQDLGIVALTIHGRTRSDLYKGSANWDPIAKVKSNPRIHIPIIGNGDVVTPEGAAYAFDHYGVDAVMVGRASIGQPWVFRDMRFFLDHGFLPEPLTEDECLDVLKAMVHNNIEKLDERRGILHSRRHLAATPLFKGIRDFRPLRIAMLQARTLQELEGVLENIRPLLKNKV